MFLSALIADDIKNHYMCISRTLMHHVHAVKVVKNHSFRAVVPKLYVTTLWSAINQKDLKILP